MNVRALGTGITLLALMNCASQPARVTDISFGAIADSPRFAVYFVVDQECDADWVVGMFKQNDPAGLPSRAKSMGIDPVLAQKIRDTPDFISARKLAQGIVDSQFEKHRSEISAARGEFRDLWRELVGPFSRIVVETTQSPWVHASYFCVVSAIHPGVSDWVGNRVGIRFDRRRISNKDTRSRVDTFRRVPAVPNKTQRGRDRRLASLGILRDYRSADSERLAATPVLAEVSTRREILQSIELPATCWP